MTQSKKNPEAVAIDQIVGINEHGVAVDASVAITIEIEKTKFDILYFELLDGKFIVSSQPETRISGGGALPWLRNEHFEKLEDGVGHELTWLLGYFERLTNRKPSDVVANAKKMIAEIRKRLHPQLPLCWR